MIWIQYSWINVSLAPNLTPLLIIESLEIKSLLLIIEFIINIIITIFFIRFKRWEYSILKPIVLNLGWFSIIAIFNFLLYVSSILSYFFSFLINLSIGLILIKILYQKEFMDSVLMVTFILIMGLCINLIIYSGVFIISQNILNRYSTDLENVDYQIYIKIIEKIKVETIISIIFWSLSIMILTVSCIICIKLLFKRIRGKIKLS